MAAMLVAAVAAPVIAQDDVQDYRDYVEPPVEGDYAAQCVPPLQFGNTGNFNNAPGFLQYDSTGESEFEPDLATACEETPQLSSAASS